MLVNPKADEAQIIFMRSSFVGSAISASVYDVTDGKTEFIEILENGTKLEYKTGTGKHTFLVVSEAAGIYAGRDEEITCRYGKAYIAAI